LRGWFSVIRPTSSNIITGVRVWICVAHGHGI
jgi:hypothetical protein